MSTQVSPGMARRAIDVPALLKDAVMTAFVSFFLAFPLIGLQTYDQNGALSVRGRWDLLAYAVIAGFVGRLLFKLFLEFKPVKKSAEPTPESIARQKMIGMVLRYVLLGIAISLPFLPFSDRSWLDRGINVLIYVMLGWGLNIVVGLAGLLDLGYVAFYAVGAYSYALLSINFGLTSGSACRSPGCSPRSSAFCSAHRPCGCAAIISPSSRLVSGKSSASCC